MKLPTTNMKVITNNRPEGRILPLANIMFSKRTGYFTWLALSTLMILSQSRLFAQCAETSADRVTVCSIPGGFRLYANSICQPGVSCSSVTMHRWYTAQVGGQSIPTASSEVNPGPPGTPPGYRSSISVSQPGTYWVEPECNGVAMPRIAASVQIRQDTPIEIVPSSPPVSVCSSDFSLTAKYATNFTWWQGEPNQPGSLSLGSATTIYPTTSATYFLRGYTTGGCNTLQTKSIVVSFATPMTVSNITPPSGNRCQGAGTTQFSAEVTNGESYWSVEAGNSTINDGLVTWDPEFSGTATILLSAYGCTGSQQQTIERTATFAVNPSVQVTVDIGGNRSVCPGSPITFHAQVNRTENVASYEWLRDGSSQIIHNPADPQNLTINDWDYPDGTTISCRILTSGCTQSSYVTSTPVVVSRQTKVPFSATLDITPTRSPGFEYCYGEQVTFTATASHPASFSWQRSTGGSGSGNTVTVNDFRGGDDYFTFTAHANASSACLENTSTVVSTEHYPINVFNLTPLEGIEGPQPERCMGAGTSQFTSGFTNYKNYSWSIENAGSSQMSTGGMVTWDPEFYGMAKVIISAQGCNGTTYTTVTQSRDYKVGISKVESLDVDQEGPLCQNVPAEFIAEAIGDRFEWSATGGATISPNGTSAIITWPDFSGYAIVTLKAFACNEISVTEKSITVEVKGTTSITSLLGPENLCYPVSQTNFTAYAYNASGFRWSIEPATAGSISQDGVVTWDPAFKDNTATISVEALGCAGYTAPRTLPVTIHTTRPTEVPVVTQPYYVPYNKVIRLEATGASAGQIYYWYREDGWRLAGNQSDPIQGTTTYFVTIAELATTCESDPVPFTISLIENNYNYVKETTVLVENQRDVETIDVLPVEQKSVTMNYFDGLGRPMQSIQVQGSPSGADIVQPIVYDQFGREAVKYLPYTSGNDGWYKTDFLSREDENEDGDYSTSPQYEFYQSTHEVASDVKPYSVTVFEPSPLNRVLKQGAPGTAWQPDEAKPTALNDHSVKMRYETNGVDDVLLLEYDETAEALDLDNGLTYYSPNQLYANKTFDEHNNEVSEYVDKEGRTVLKRVQYDEQSGTKLYAETYYVYDDFGNLVMVLPPEGVKALRAAVE